MNLGSSSSLAGSSLAEKANHRGGLDSIKVDPWHSQNNLQEEVTSLETWKQDRLHRAILRVSEQTNLFTTTIGVISAFLSFLGTTLTVQLARSHSTAWSGSLLVSAGELAIGQ